MSGKDAFSKDGVLVVADLAKELHYSDRYIRHLLNSGRIKGSKLNERGQWRVLRSELNRYKKESGLSGKAGLEQTIELEAKEQQAVLDTEQRNLARQHDVKIFEKSDAILSEEDIEISLGVGLENMGFIHPSEVSQLSDFQIFFLWWEANKYINPTLRSLCESVCQKIVELERFIHRHGLILDKDAEPPEHVMRQLRQLSESCRAAYRSYRVAVREILLV